MLYFSGKRSFGLCLAVAVALLCAGAHAEGTWSAAGSLATARYYHTATLLPSGKVLVAGGSSASGGSLASAELYDPGTNTWTAAGSLATTRDDFSATLLPNGKVLVAGGPDTSTELYDPGTNTWSAAGSSLAAKRVDHTATLLHSGKVLVVGGQSGGGGGYLASAELYDPGTDTWGAAGSLATTRGVHTATLLPSGKVLVAGGFSGSADLASAELYDPGTNTWSAAGSLAATRWRHTATLLPSGKILVAGGYISGSGAVASAEIYDPGTNTWSAAGTLVTARENHTATLLPNGNVLVAGGSPDGTTSLSSAESYDPGTNTWSAAGSLATARYFCTATLLPSGKVLVAGGSPDGSTSVASAEIYDYSGGGSWSAAASLATARENHTATLLPSGNVLVAGGGDGNACLASAELYDPGTNTWSAAGGLATARSAHTATLLPSGKVLVAGGLTNGNVILASAELYDPETNTWSAAGSLATMREWHTATLLPSGRVLIAAGYNDGDGDLASAELYDPGTNTWSAAGSLATGRMQHTATLLPGGNVLVAGGAGSVILTSAELYDPGTSTWSAAGSLATARMSHTATLLPSGKVLAAGGYNGSTTTASAELYDPGTNTWSAAASLATARDRDTATLLPSGNVLVAAGEGNGNYLASAELYDPGTNTWNAAGSLAAQRRFHTATLLPNGKVLVAGGDYYDGSYHYLASAELYDPGLGFQDSWRPAISSATSPLAVNEKLVLGGSGFKGLSEASGGGTASTATNYPLVQLQSLVNEQVAFLLSDPASNWSDTSFTSAAVNGFPPGPAQVTVFTNGIPSLSKALTVNAPPSAPAITSTSATQSTLLPGDTTTLSAQASNPNNGTLTFTWNFADGTAAGTGNPIDHLFAAAGQYTVSVTANDGTYTSQPAEIVITVEAPNSGADGVPNIAPTGPAGEVTNPVDGFGMTVASSNGGVIELALDDQNLINRSAYDASTDFLGLGQTPVQGGSKVPGYRPAAKFSTSGLYVAEASLFPHGDTTIRKGHGRLTLAVSQREIDGTTNYDPSTEFPRSITPKSLRAKLDLSGAAKARADSVTFSGLMQLPVGLKLPSKTSSRASETMDLAVGIGNIIDHVAVDSRGRTSSKNTGDAGNVKSVSVRFPKADKKTGLTFGTAKQRMATVTVTLSNKAFVANGFDTEGVSGTPKANTLKIQTAIVLAGITYQSKVTAGIKVTKKHGTADSASLMQTRAQ